MKVIFAPRALRDLEAIAAYLAERSPTGQKSVLGAIKASIGDLEQFPRIGIPIDTEGRYRLPVRRYPYLVYYRVAASELFILHIRHGAREPIDPSVL